METKEFDKFLKEKISSIKEPFLESDWETFQSSVPHFKSARTKTTLWIWPFILMLFFQLKLNPQINLNEIPKYTIESQLNTHSKQQLVKEEEKIIQDLTKIKQVINHSIHQEKIEKTLVSEHPIIADVKLPDNNLDEIVQGLNIITYTNSEIVTKAFSQKFKQKDFLNNRIEPLQFSGLPVLVINPNEKIEPQIKSQSKSKTYLGLGLNLASIENFSIKNSYYLTVQRLIHIKDKHLVGIGLTYSKINKEFETRTYYKQIYDFGITLQTTNISTYGLDFIELPMVYQYQTGKKSGLTFGLKPGYLLQTYSTVEIIKSGDIESQEKFDQSGYTSAFNKFNLNASLAYKYSLTKRINIETSINYGLIDLTKNDVFKSTQKNRLSNIQFGLNYQL
jgi:hypothetical protein